MAEISLYLAHIPIAMLSKNQAKIVKSLRLKKQRLEQGLFVVEGSKIVAELLSSDYKVRELFVSGENFVLQFPEATQISAREMQQISNLATPPGVLAVVELPQWYIAPDENSIAGKRFIALDGLRDPGNLGTIMRSVAWFGFDGILASTDCVDCFNPKVLQASMGSFLHTPVYYGDLRTLFSALDLPVYGLDLSGESLFSSDLDTGVFVVGSESHGLRPDVRQLITRYLLIDGAGGTESLNAAVSASIVMAEVWRTSNAKK